MIASPSVADMDDDGYLDIVMAGWLAVYSWDRFGLNLPGYPLIGALCMMDGPVIGDLDNDGYEEFVCVGNFGYFISTLVMIDDEGTALLVVGGFGAIAEPSLSDVDSNGYLDLLVFIALDTNKNMEIWTFDYSTSPIGVDILPGWPIFLDGTWLAIHNVPVVVDMDGDGDVEVIMGITDGNVYAWHHNGNEGDPIADWPKATGGEIVSSAAVGDVDLDGNLEIIVCSKDSWVYLYEAGQYDASKTTWGVYEHDLRHTNKYNDPPIPDLVVNGDTDDDIVVDMFDVVNFDGTGSSDSDGVIDKYMIDFADPLPTIQNHWTSQGTDTHVYRTPGVFTARLMVRDDEGLECLQADFVQITVNFKDDPIGNLPPQANLIVDAPLGLSFLTVDIGSPVTFIGEHSFDPNPLDTIIEYEFNFGDGTIYSETPGSNDGTFDGNTQYEYTVVGIYTPTLRVKDTSNAWSTLDYGIEIRVILLDSDHDGLRNIEELVEGLDPFDFDTDDDGLLDGWFDYNGNGQWDSAIPQEIKGEMGVYGGVNKGQGGYGTDPDNPDSEQPSGDYLMDGWNDMNNNGRWDYWEIWGEIGDNTITSGDNGGFGTEPLTDRDSDDDGIIDGVEPNALDIPPQTVNSLVEGSLPYEIDFTTPGEQTVSVELPRSSLSTLQVTSTEITISRNYNQQKIQLSDVLNNNDQRNPAVYEDPQRGRASVVWEEDRHGNWDIFMYDLSIDTDADDNPNYLDNSDVDYLDPDDTDGDGNIYEPDGVSDIDNYGKDDDSDGNIDEEIFNGIDDDGDSRIDEDIIDPAESRITTDSKDQRYPDIYDNFIVWEEQWGSDIHLYDLGSDGRFGTADDRGEVEITYKWNDIRPKINGERIVWYSSRDNNKMNIYMYDLSIDTDTDNIPNYLDNSDVDYLDPADFDGDGNIYEPDGTPDPDNYGHGGEDNDGFSDEEFFNGIDDDGDGLIDEDIMDPAIYRITMSQDDDRYPVIWWDNIAFEREPVGGGNDIYMYDLTVDSDNDGVPNYIDIDDDGDGTPDGSDPDPDLAEMPIDTSGGKQRAPSIYQNKIVYYEMEDNGQGQDGIYMYDIINSEKIPIYLDYLFTKDPRIFGNIIIWERHFDIYCYDLLTSYLYTGASDGEYQFSPAICGKKIVWFSSPDYGGDGNIKLMDLSKTAYTFLDVGNDLTWQWSTAVPIQGSITVNDDLHQVTGIFNKILAENEGTGDPVEVSLRFYSDSPGEITITNLGIILSPIESRPDRFDTDDDGLWDGVTIGVNTGELSIGTYSNDPDTDGDGIDDGDEVNSDPGRNPFYQDLFMEVDYMVGCKPLTNMPNNNPQRWIPQNFDPSTDTLDYIIAYYYSLGISVHIDLDDELAEDDIDLDGDDQIRNELDYDDDGRIDTYEDVGGTDGVPSHEEPGYNAETNPDPTGDDYHPVNNPTGTENNGIIDGSEDDDGDGKLDLLFTAFPEGNPWRYGNDWITGDSEDTDGDGNLDDELYQNEENHHDNADYLYVIFLKDCQLLANAWDYGAVIDIDVFDMIGVPRAIAETNVFLHEVGHCIDIGYVEEPDENGDLIMDREIYCSLDSDLTGGYHYCIMTIGFITTGFVDNPIYCSECKSSVTLDNVWSTTTGATLNWYSN
jgi:heat shock protein beta